MWGSSRHLKGGQWPAGPGYRYISPRELSQGPGREGVKGGWVGGKEGMREVPLLFISLEDLEGKTRVFEKCSRGLERG